ncbi:MAG: hypothetical protein KAG61_11940 [Bacteriovoracaceae bacterium]|nr:hypothetical protein [Bacteriovoracaceae bacterium]
MRKDLNIKEGDIVLIPPAKGGGNFCRLNEYINLLKYLRVKPPFDFSYVGAESQMIEDLTIKENIEIIYHNSLDRKNPFEQLVLKLKSDNRPNLSQLLESIEMIDLYPGKASPSQRKLAGIIKALIKPSKFLFFEDIESNLTRSLVKLVSNAIVEHCSKYDCTLFIKSSDNDFWFRHANKVITREEDLSYSFSTIVKDNISFVDFNSKLDSEDEPLPSKLSA